MNISLKLYWILKLIFFVGHSLNMHVVWIWKEKWIELEGLDLLIQGLESAQLYSRLCASPDV